MENSTTWADSRRFILVSEARSRMRLAEAAAKEGDCTKAQHEAGVVTGIAMAVSTLKDNWLCKEMEQIQDELIQRLIKQKGKCRCRVTL